MQRQLLLLAALLVSGCGDSTDPSPTYEPIGTSEAGIHAVVEATLRQTLTVRGRCAGPHYINCPDSSTLAQPFTVDLVPDSISYAPLPNIPGGYTYVATLHITTSRPVMIRIGDAQCAMSLSAEGFPPARFLVAGNAKPIRPSDARPYYWVDVMQEMMGGIEPAGVTISGLLDCDPNGFDPHGMSVLIGELLPRLQAICKPSSGDYQSCPIPLRTSS